MRPGAEDTSQRELFVSEAPERGVEPRTGRLTMPSPGRATILSALVEAMAVLLLLNDHRNVHDPDAVDERRETRARARNARGVGRVDAGGITRRTLLTTRPRSTCAVSSPAEWTYDRIAECLLQLRSLAGARVRSGMGH